MIMIVTGHFYVTQEATSQVFVFVYAFHVPLFFFLSGLLFKGGSGSFLGGLAKRSRAIVVPFFVWGLLTYVAYLALGAAASVALDRPLRHLSIPEALWSLVYGNPDGQGFEWNRPLWFLPAIMVASVIAMLLDRAAAGRARTAILSAVLGLSTISGLYAAQHPEWSLPWSIERVLVLFPFMVLGMLLRPFVGRLAHQPRGSHRLGLITVATLLAVLTYLLARQNTLVDYVAKAYGLNHMAFYGSALLGIVAVLCLAVALPGWRPLEKVGEDSLPILCWHKLVVVALQMIFVRIHAQGLVPMDLLVLAGGALSTVISALITPVIQRIWPQSIGRSRRSLTR